MTYPKVDFLPADAMVSGARVDDASRRHDGVVASPNFPATEERILKYWDEDGTFIASWKFTPGGSAVVGGYTVNGFVTNAVPFPTVDSPLAIVPCIAFNYLGQLTYDGQNPAGAHEYIPLARGSVYPVMDANKALQFSSPSVSELPPGNSTSSAFNLVDIDPLTGRATLRFQKVQ